MAEKLLEKYPTYLPLIIKPHDKCEIKLEKTKYLFPKDAPVSHIVTILRKRITLSSEQAIFIFIDGKLPPLTETISSIYQKYKDSDGFLNVIVSTENTFG